MAASLAIRVGAHGAGPGIMQLMELSQPTDGQLIARIAGGDRGAFEELHGRYARAVLGLALRRLGDRGRAEDATQDAFIAIWRSARTYDPSRGRGAPWLYAVARNAITDGLRRTPEPVAELEDGPGRDPGPSDEAEASWTAWRVHRALEVLPEHEGSFYVQRRAGSHSRPPIWRSRHRARLLERVLAERDRGTARDPARHGQDADAQRPRTSCRRSGRGAAMRPDFDELVGTDLPSGERERLERVHELLVAAGPPPPELVPVTRLELQPHRRRGALLALAAALAVAAFALGAALVDGASGRNVDFTETMTGTPSAANATASLAVFDIDAAGNWPMELTVAALPPAQSGRAFELWLTRDGELAALCGGFLTDADGSAVVPMNAPYRFDDFDGWVIVEEGSPAPLLTT